MPLPDVHPLHETAVGTTTATVASAQTATVRAPYTGRVVKIAASPGVATGGGTATCTVTIAGTTAGTIAVPISTATDTATTLYASCTEGDPIVFTFSGSGTGGGVCGLTAYVRRGA
jgi:hypothetical protein